MPEFSSFGDIDFYKDARLSSGDFIGRDFSAITDPAAKKAYEGFVGNDPGAGRTLLDLMSNNPDTLAQFKSIATGNEYVPGSSGGGGGGEGGSPDPAATTGVTLGDIDKRHEASLAMTGTNALSPYMSSTFTHTPMELKPEELQKHQTLGAEPTATTFLSDGATNIAAPTPTDATTMSPYMAFLAEQMTAAQKATLSPEAIMEAANGVVTPESTVQFQLAGLLDQFKDGAVPAWAAGAVRNANLAMAQRGLGKSSMAGSAILSSAMEAATPIAAHDASVYDRINHLNIQNLQDARKFNATMAGQLDFANLNNEQRASEVNMQARQQVLLSDQAAMNASKQFNATSKNQMDQFFASLGKEIAINNATRTDAMEQFDVDQVNTTAKFNSQMVDARDRFETQMRVQIDQSNAEWRRKINTANTAAINRTNQLNVQAMLGISATAQANLWQQYRDEAHWVMQSSENQRTRQHNLAAAAMQHKFQAEMFDAASEEATNTAIGKFIGGVFTTGFEHFLKK